MLDLLIRNGQVVTLQGVARWTVGISGEQIAYLGIDDPSMQAGRTINADGKIVVPGGIEPHAHLDIFDLTNPDSGKSTLGPEEDTRGMAYGGTTTHLDFCFVEPSMEITNAIEERAAQDLRRIKVVALGQESHRFFDAARCLNEAVPVGIFLHAQNKLAVEILRGVVFESCSGFLFWRLAYHYGLGHSNVLSCFSF